MLMPEINYIAATMGINRVNVNRPRLTRVREALNEELGFSRKAAMSAQSAG